MLKTKVSGAFFALLRAGLWNKPVDSEECFPLSDTEWKKVFEISVQQTVQGIIFDGVQKLSSKKLPPKEIHIKWLLITEKIGRRNLQMNEIIAEQYSFFSKNGIYPVLLKGQSLAVCYDDPLKRVCGDIDWWFQSKKDFDNANKLLNKIGIYPKFTAGFSNVYWWKTFEIDNHVKLFDLHNPLCFRYLNDLKSLEKNNYVRLDVHEERVLTLSPFLQILQVNAHILKHLLSFGIGVRQFCDIARLYHSCYDKKNELFPKKVYKKLRIIKWINILHEVLVRYIGLDENNLPFELYDSQKSDLMVKDLYRSGNFGFYDEYYYDLKLHKRMNKNKKIFSQMVKYFPYAPIESVSFPLVHFFSGLMKR